MKQKIAIVGSGVSGLVVGRMLHAADYEFTLYEADSRLGGHAHTVIVSDEEQDLALDTGFIVFNEATYPRFTALLEELGVPSQFSDMSFGVNCTHCQLEYSSRGLLGLFSQPKQLFRPSLYLMAADIIRFNHWGKKQLDDGSLTPNMTIGDLMQSGQFGEPFFRHYLVPMTSAIWSSPMTDIRKFPLQLFLRFFSNHGLLQINSHPPWRTIVGGSQRYVESLVRPFRQHIRLRAPVEKIRRNADGVELHTSCVGWEHYDKVVIATHADQALELLDEPTTQENDALGAIPYSSNLAVLHTDTKVLPRSQRAWASWNYHISDCNSASTPLTMTYYLNRLQRLTTNKSYYVTLNAMDCIEHSTILARIRYEHPLYTADGLKARTDIRLISGRNHTFYCGSYLGNGFHEDGIVSGLETSEALLGSRRSS